MAFAIIFNDVGVGEWFVLLAVILVVMGPKRLPETARTFGKYYSKFRRAADNFKRQLLDMDAEFDRAVQEAEREASAAFTVDDAAPPPPQSADRVDDTAGAYPGAEAYPPPEPDVGEETPR